MIIKHFRASEIIQILTNNIKTPGNNEKPTSKQWKNSCRCKIKPLRFLILNKLTKIYSNNFSVKIRYGIFKAYQGKNILLSQIQRNNYYNEMVKGKSLICIVLVFILYLIEVKVHIVTSCNCGLFSLASCFDSSINIYWMFPKWVSGWVSAPIINFHKYLCSIYINAITTMINFF